MPPARPLECPACGHERIARRPPRLQSEVRPPRTGITEWICQLCSYTWSRPGVPRHPVWEPE